VYGLEGLARNVLAKSADCMKEGPGGMILIYLQFDNSFGEASSSLMKGFLWALCSLTSILRGNYFQ